MKNFHSKGDVVTLPAPSGGVSSGEAALIGSIFGVAQVDGDEGVDTAFTVVGCFDLPKVSAQAWTVGAKIYWDAGDSVATTTSTDNTLIGAAIAGAANPSGTGRVRLNGIAA